MAVNHKKGVTINGKHTYRDLGLILVDGSEKIGLPEVQSYTVEVPGRNGLLDLTDALTGDVTFKNRECSWQFADAREYGKRTDALVKLYNMLHGRRLPFILDDRQDYTGKGRFTAEIEENRNGYTLINVTADCDPYFSKGLKTLKIHAAGGVTAYVESGRMPVCPVFEFYSETIVKMGDVCMQLPPGTYKLTDLWLQEGTNEIYLNSYLGDGNVLISTYEEATIRNYIDKMISELMWDGPVFAAMTISGWANDTISMHSEETVIEAEYSISTETEKYAVYIQYEIADL